MFFLNEKKKGNRVGRYLVHTPNVLTHIGVKCGSSGRAGV